jgi:hypothetical protein
LRTVNNIIYVYSYFYVTDEHTPKNTKDNSLHVNKLEQMQILSNTYNKEGWR